MGKQSANMQHTNASGAQGDGDVVITDINGRKIRMKSPGVLAHYKLVEALGESAKNQMYMAMVVPLLYIVSIDDHPVRTPSNKTEIENLIERLGEAGIAAMMQCMMQHFMPRPSDIGPLAPAGELAAHEAA